jgi:hypothetical protein
VYCTCLALSCLSAFFLWVAGHAPSKAVKELDVQRIQLQNVPEKASAAFSFFSIRHMRASHHCCDVQCSRFCFFYKYHRAMLGCSACLFGTYNNINKSLYLAYTHNPTVSEQARTIVLNSTRHDDDGGETSAHVDACGRAWSPEPPVGWLSLAPQQPTPTFCPV